MNLLTLLTSTLEGSGLSNIVVLVGCKNFSLITEQYVDGVTESNLLEKTISVRTES
jgi:hypothetical protein